MKVLLQGEGKPEFLSMKQINEQIHAQSIHNNAETILMGWTKKELVAAIMDSFTYEETKQFIQENSDN